MVTPSMFFGGPQFILNIKLLRWATFIKIFSIFLSFKFMMFSDIIILNLFGGF